MIDSLLKKKLRFNDPLTFTESHILYDYIDKLEKIEQIIDDCDLEAWEVLEKIKEVVEQE